MKLIAKLLSHLHRGFDRDPERVLAIRVRHATSLTWQVSGGVLSITTPGGTTNIALSDFTVGELRDELLAQGLDVPYFDAVLSDRAAVILLDGSGDQAESNGDRLYVYTSLLWAFMGAYGAELEIIRSVIQSIPDQMRLPTSRNEWLDFLGDWYGLPRQDGESDEVYSQRFVADVLKPKCNNVAIQDALATRFGLTLDQLSVVDAPLTPYNTIPPSGHTHHYCEFDVELEVPYGSIDIFELPELVKPLRVHGTRLRRISTELHTRVPKVAAGSVTGDITLVHPVIAEEIEASGTTYSAAAVVGYEINTVYPGQP